MYRWSCCRLHELSVLQQRLYCSINKHRVGGEGGGGGEGGRGEGCQNSSIGRRPIDS